MPTNEKQKAVEFLTNWARWCNTDELGPLGYPSSTAEQRTVYSISAGEKLRQIRTHRWGANPKNSRSMKSRCPDWDIEMEVEAIVNSLHKTYQTILHCEYEVMLDHKKMARFGLSPRNFQLLGYNGKYTWARFKRDRVSATGHCKTTYYGLLSDAMDTIIQTPRFRSMLSRRLAA